jgi:CRISPR-associated protein Cas1
VGAPAQYNWLTGAYEAPAVQLRLEIQWVPESGEWQAEALEGVLLLATETGTQLLVSGQGLSLGKHSERLTIKRHRRLCGEIPLFRLQEVVVMGRGISVSSDLIEEACARGIRMGFTALNGRPLALLTSPYLTATVETRKAQLAATGNERGAQFIRWLVAGKLRNQEKVLRYFGKSREGEAAKAMTDAAAGIRVLRRKALGLEGATPEEIRAPAMGLEGAAGRLYWGALAKTLPRGLGFHGRTAESPVDGVNCALNFGYGILYSHVWGAVMNAGLEPFAGFLHTDRPGKPSLVLDLTEEFRQPVVDRPLLAWLFKGGVPGVREGLLDEAARGQVAERVLARMNAREMHRGKEHQIRSIIQMQARLAASALRGLRDYKPFTFRW